LALRAGPGHQASGYPTLFLQGYFPHREKSIFFSGLEKAVLALTPRSAGLTGFCPDPETPNAARMTGYARSVENGSAMCGIAQMGPQPEKIPRSSFF